MKSTLTTFHMEFVKPKFIEKPVKKHRPPKNLAQKEIFKAIKDALHCIINAPTGMGKSHCIKMKAVHDHAKTGRLQVIVVPQVIIGSSFVGEPYYLKVGNKNEEFIVNDAYNLVKSHTILSTDDKDDETDSLCNNKVDRLESFLKSKKGANSGILVCTHSTLVRFFSNPSKRNLMKNAAFFIDEAHHLHCSDNNDQSDTNQLGKVFEYIMDNDIPLTLSTATLFRGDRQDVIPDRFIQNATIYELPIDYYLEHVTDHLAGISTMVTRTRNRPEDGIQTYVKDNEFEKSIIFLPSVGSRMCPTIEEKYLIRDNIMDIYSRKFAGRKGKWVWKGGYYECNGMTLIDLVEDRVIDGINYRQQAKQYVFDNKNKMDDPDFAPDVVISLGIGKEGMDFPQCSLCHLMSYRNSLTELLQIMGRVLRDVKDKPIAKLNLILESVETEDFMGRINQYFNYIYMTMMLEEVLQPSMSSVVKGRTTVETTNRQHISDIIGPDITEEILVYVAGITDDECESIREGITRILEENGVDETLWERVIRMHERTVGNMMRLSGIDISDFEHELFSDERARGSVYQYMAECVTVNVIKKYREYINLKNAQLEEVLLDIQDAKVGNGNIWAINWINMTGVRSGINLGNRMTSFRDGRMNRKISQILLKDPIKFSNIMDFLEYVYYEKNDIGDELRLRDYLDTMLQNFKNTSGKQIVLKQRSEEDKVTTKYGKTIVFSSALRSLQRKKQGAEQQLIDMAYSDPRYSEIREMVVAFFKSKDTIEEHMSRTQEIIDFYQKNDRLPLITRCEPNGNWIKGRRDVERGHGHYVALVDDARELLREHGLYEIFFGLDTMTNDQRHEQLMQALRDHVSLYATKPSRGSKDLLIDEEIQKLAVSLKGQASGERGTGSSVKFSEAMKSKWQKEYNIMMGDNDELPSHHAVCAGIARFKEYVNVFYETGNIPTNRDHEGLYTWGRRLHSRQCFVNPYFQQECHKIDTKMAIELGIPKP